MMTKFKLTRTLLGLLVATLITGCSSRSLQNPDTGTIQDTEVKDQLITAAKRAYDRELTFGSGGDISMRIPGKPYFIIKGTGECFGFLDRQKLATVSLENGQVLLDSPEPSHETNIHLALYNSKPEVNAIMHVHAPFATAWATAGKPIPEITQQSARLLKNQKTIPYYTPGSVGLLQNVVSSYEDPDVHLVLMQNHGFFIIGKDLDDILNKAETVENAARIAYLTLSMGNPAKFEYSPPIRYDQH